MTLWLPVAVGHGLQADPSLPVVLVSVVSELLAPPELPELLELFVLEVVALFAPNAPPVVRVD